MRPFLLRGTLSSIKKTDILKIENGDITFWDMISWGIILPDFIAFANWKVPPVKLGSKWYEQKSESY